MKRPKDLTREQLEQIVDEVQQALYLGYDEEGDDFAWTPEKNWSGYDVCEALAAVLSQMSMVPEEQIPFK